MPISTDGADLRKLVKQRRQDRRQRAVGRADREAARRCRGIERLGGGDDAPRLREDFGDRAGEFLRTLGRHDAFRGPQEQRIVEQPAQPRQGRG